MSYGGDTQESDFSRNLRLLTSYYRSVSDVCRRLGVNRQQFNKYLSGAAIPSRHNLRRLCEFFGVSEGEIFLPHRRFSEIVDLRPRNRAPSAEQPAFMQHIERLRRMSGAQLDSYVGYYFRYFYSYGFPGQIVKSLLGVFRKGDLYYTKNLGALSAKRGERGHSVRFKYVGLPLLINDRIFLIEYESLIGDMISETILYPAFRHRLDLLLGVQCTLAGRRTREPAAGKVVLEFLGRDIDRRRALRACGLFPGDSHEITPFIKALIDNRIPDAHVLLVSED